ncbi:MAG: J domain-containing protein, partial [Planctomycetota bacterium]
DATPPPGDWQHLPQNPLAFFGLPADFERRDLKRAYGKLIRQHKPETHPTEFQLIRAAYERLESEQRYGQIRDNASRAVDAWSMPQTPDEPTPRERTLGPVRSLVDEATTHPKQTFESLRSKPSRTPQEYYVLAVLSDLVRREEAHAFFRWILTGLKEHPRDAALHALTREYLAGEVTLSDASKLLLTTSKCVSDSRFYRVTEALWERWIRQDDFERVLPVLGACQKNLQETDPPQRHAFHLRLLRVAIWKAPPEWTNRVIDQLNASQADMDDWMHNELEFVTMLRDFLITSASFVGVSEGRAQLQELIHAYCTGDGPEQLGRATEILDQIARDAGAMINAFPVDPNRDDSATLLLTFQACADLEDTVYQEPDKEQEERSNRQAKSLIEDLRGTLDSVGGKISSVEFRYKWLFGAALCLLLSFLFIFVTGTVTIALTDNDAAMGISLVSALIAGPIATVLLIRLYFYPRHFEPRVERHRDRILLDAYRDVWRARIFRFVQSCGEPANTALARVEHQACDSEDANWVGVVCSYCRMDIGLILFGRAQPFRY